MKTLKKVRTILRFLSWCVSDCISELGSDVDGHPKRYLAT